MTLKSYWEDPMEGWQGSRPEKHQQSPTMAQEDTGRKGSHAKLHPSPHFGQAQAELSWPPASMTQAQRGREAYLQTVNATTWGPGSQGVVQSVKELSLKWEPIHVRSHGITRLSASNSQSRLWILIEKVEFVLLIQSCSSPSLHFPLLSSLVTKAYVDLTSLRSLRGKWTVFKPSKPFSWDLRMGTQARTWHRLAVYFRTC